MFSSNNVSSDFSTLPKLRSYILQLEFPAPFTKSPSSSLAKEKEVIGSARNDKNEKYGDYKNTKDDDLDCCMDLDCMDLNDLNDSYQIKKGPSNLNPDEDQVILKELQWLMGQLPPEEMKIEIEQCIRRIMCNSIPLPEEVQSPEEIESTKNKGDSSSDLLLKQQKFERQKRQQLLIEGFVNVIFRDLSGEIFKEEVYDPRVRIGEISHFLELDMKVGDKIPSGNRMKGTTQYDSYRFIKFSCEIRKENATMNNNLYNNMNNNLYNNMNNNLYSNMLLLPPLGGSKVSDVSDNSYLPSDKTIARICGDTYQQFLDERGIDLESDQFDKNIELVFSNIIGHSAKSYSIISNYGIDDNVYVYSRTMAGWVPCKITHLSKDKTFAEVETRIEKGYYDNNPFFHAGVALKQIPIRRVRALGEVDEKEIFGAGSQRDSAGKMCGVDKSYGGSTFLAPTLELTALICPLPEKIVTGSYRYKRRESEFRTVVVDGNETVANPLQGLRWDEINLSRNPIRNPVSNTSSPLSVSRLSASLSGNGRNPISGNNATGWGSSSMQSSTMQNNRNEETQPEMQSFIQSFTYERYREGEPGVSDGYWEVYSGNWEIREDIEVPDTSGVSSSSGPLSGAVSNGGSNDISVPLAPTILDLYIMSFEIVRIRFGTRTTGEEQPFRPHGIRCIARFVYDEKDTQLLRQEVTKIPRCYSLTVAGVLTGSGVNQNEDLPFPEWSDIGGVFSKQFVGL